MMKTLSLVLLVVAVAAGGAFWYYHANSTPTPNFRTAPVERGYLRASVGATGTIEPEEVIDVGAQVAGRIDRFGVDPRSQDQQLALAVTAAFPRSGNPIGLALTQLALVKLIDYGSPVNEGTVLAQLDPSLYQARVDSTAADLIRAKAALGQMEAVLYQAEREWTRVQNLIRTRSVAQSDFDVARSAYETARANLEVGKAAIGVAQANLKEAKTNLGYTTIRSPVKGVIVDRRVNIGQTVVASLNAPSLFLIAKDLKRLQVWASVNEADIGMIKAGQMVYFTVDTFPGQTFVGNVAPDQPRLNASMTNNVVTYTVVVNTDNSTGRLLPYLTANLQFVTGERENALLVPNSALRWTPPLKYVVSEAREAYLKSAHQKKRPGGAVRPKGPGAGKQQPAARYATVWVVAENGLARPIRVRIGLNDGNVTEVLSAELREDMEVIVGEAPRQDNGGGGNPFAPELFKGKKKE
jgi:HlyD family secretion protein